MQGTRLRTLFVVGVLAVLTVTVMAWARGGLTSVSPGGSNLTSGGSSGVVSINAQLAQDKIYSNGDGEVSLSLTMTADEIAAEHERGRNVDIVIVLDRSGSMEGEKLADAKQAILEMLASMGEDDRVSLISYSDNVTTHFPLTACTPANRELLGTAVNMVAAYGNTNLGAGLMEGMRQLAGNRRAGNLGKVVLISDGLANEGVTDPSALAEMASAAIQGEFAVSTVGVGLDFNEQVMSAIADRGAGNYYFMESPVEFARVFLQEFNLTREVAATGVEVRVNLPGGVELVDAAGLPVECSDNQIIFHPGDLLSGRSRTLHLTFLVPTGREASYDLSNLSVRYTYGNETYTVTLDDPLIVACVMDETEALASINPAVWENKVLQEDYNALREEVAGAIASGDYDTAMDRIDAYEQEQSTLNSHVGSEAVEENLERDLSDLRSTVDQAFTGSDEEQAYRQDLSSRALQNEGFAERRAKAY